MAERAFTLSGAVMKRTKDDGDLVVDMAFASDKPYERWWGIEVLDMSAKSVRLGRLNDGDGGPVLFNHDWMDLRGSHVPGSVRVHDDGFLRGQIVIPAATQVTRDTIALVESKTLSKASTGYQIHRVIEQTTAKGGEKLEREIDGAVFERLIDSHCTKRDGRVVGGDIAAFHRSLDEHVGVIERAADDPPIYRVVDWEPLENSLVTVPADNSVGVGRSAAQITFAPVIQIDARSDTAQVAQLVQKAIAETPNQRVLQPAAPSALKGAVMAIAENAAAGANAEHTGNFAALSAMELEQQRRTGIEYTVKANKLDGRLASKWIEDGTPLHEVAKQVMDVMEERGKAKPAAASALGLSTRETQQYSLFKAIRALRFGGQTRRFMEEAAFEIECSNAVCRQLGRGDTTSILIPGEVLTRPMDAMTMQRAMATSPGSKGGYMVNVENMGFIDILRNRSVGFRMGVRNLSGLVGNAMFPRQTGKPTVTWQGGEGTSITAADQTLGQLSMSPKTAIVITDVSEQLLRQASPSAEAFVMADLAADIAIDGIDAAIINGTGGAQPLGIKNTTGVTTGQDAASATYAKILAFVSTAGGANAIRGNPGFVTNTAGAAKLMTVQRFASTDTPVWEGNMLDGSLVGFKSMSSEQLGSANLIFGSWDEVVVGDWGVLELAMDNGGTRFNQAQVGIRAMWMVDVLVRYPQAFVVSTNLS